MKRVENKIFIKILWDCRIETLAVLHNRPVALNIEVKNKIFYDTLMGKNPYETSKK